MNLARSFLSGPLVPLRPGRLSAKIVHTPYEAHGSGPLIYLPSQFTRCCVLERWTPRSRSLLSGSGFFHAGVSGPLVSLLS